MNTSANGQVIDLGSQVATHPAYYGTDWAYIALVASFAEGRRSVFGYVFFADGHWEARVPRDRDRTVMKAFRRLHDQMAAEDGVAWVQCLLEITGPDLTISADFEYEDPERWSITPANLQELVGEPSIQADPATEAP
jgi:hypothetical protein